MTLPNGYVGQRVRTRGGSAGTIKVVSTCERMPFYGVQFDEPRLEYLHFTQLMPASEESMTKTTEERLNSAEQNLVDHEHAIGDNSGKISLVEQIDMAYEHLRQDATRIESLEAAAKTGEMHLELNARRIEEVADKTARRFDGHADKMARIDGELHELKEQVAELEERLARNVVGINGDAHAVYTGVDKRLTALESLITEDKIGSWRRATEAVGGRITAHDRALNDIRSRIVGVELQLAAINERHVQADKHRRQLRNGPKSYDKRIAALDDKVSKQCEAHGANWHDIARRLAALEHRDDDPLRRVPGIYNGTGAEATDDDCGCLGGCDGSCQAAEDAMLARVLGDDPASRDENASERAILAALSDELRQTYSDSLKAGSARTEAVNRVVLHAKRLALWCEALACDIAEESL